jgi:hypothetical protein
MTMSNRLPTRDIPHGEIGVGSKLIPVFKTILATLPILLMAFTSACAGFDASVLEARMPGKRQYLHVSGLCHGSSSSRVDRD